MCLSYYLYFPISVYKSASVSFTVSLSQSLFWVPCLSLYLCLCVSVSLSQYLCLCLSVSISIDFSLSQSLPLSLCLNLCLSVSISVSQSLSLSFSLSHCHSLYICLSLFLFSPLLCNGLKSRMNITPLTLTFNWLFIKRFVLIFLVVYPHEIDKYRSCISHYFQF